MHKIGRPRPILDSWHPAVKTITMVLLATASFPSFAYAAKTSASSGRTGADRTAPTPEQPDRAPQEIIVTAPRLFFGVQPERNLDQEAIAGYGVSTIQELLAEIAAESGEDEPPLIIVNGQRVNDPDEISGLPAEALRDLQVLPRGTAVRVGGRSSQRVVNLRLQDQTRSATFTFGPKIATEGSRSSVRGEGILAHIKGSTRANLTLRIRQDSSLLESDRGIIQPEVASVLIDVDRGRFRTLLPRARNYELHGGYATRLLPWLTTSTSLRLGRSTSESLRGLPRGFLIASVTELFALRSRSDRSNADANVSFNAAVGRWTGDLNLKHARSRSLIRSERQSGFTPAAGVELTTDRSRTKEQTSLANLLMNGPILELPGGEVRGTLEGKLASRSLNSSSTFTRVGSLSEFTQDEQTVRAALDVPITTRESRFLPQLGELSATAELSGSHFSKAGTFTNSSIGLTWEPVPWLRLRASNEQTATPPTVEVLASPVIITPDVRTFDPLTGETVDVTYIYGGNPSLKAEERTVRRLTSLLRLYPRYGLEWNAEYTETDSENFISSLPEASAAITLAFPDRFVRNVTGTLTDIDFRTVNFDLHREKRLRWGLNVNAPLGRASKRKTPRTRLQASFNHTMVFLDEITIRPDLDRVDLLSGGAIGIGGGRVRQQIDSNLGISQGGTGARLGMTWRGGSTLESRINGAASTLEFSPLLMLNLRAFTDAQRLLSGSAWSKGLRLSLNITNVANERQRIRDSFGERPLQYQPAYRDPLGRTFEFEIRKVF